MAKAKRSKSNGVPHKHIHARLSYLHQASSYLLLASRSHKKEVAIERRNHDVSSEEGPSASPHVSADYAQSRHLLSQLRAVSLKSQVRLAPELKHSLCKRCNSLLIAGSTSTERIANESKGGANPWADVLVIGCLFCRTLKRFPVGMPKRPKGPALAFAKDTEAKNTGK